MPMLDRYLISLDDAVRALASSVDLVGTDELHHGQRVALMSATFAEQLNWPVASPVRLFRAAMLHDCGGVPQPGASRPDRPDGMGRSRGALHPRA